MRPFKEYKFINASMAALMREVGEEFLKSKMVKGSKNQLFPEYTQRVLSNCIEEKKMVCLLRGGTFQVGGHGTT